MRPVSLLRVPSWNGNGFRLRLFFLSRQRFRQPLRFVRQNIRALGICIRQRNRTHQRRAHRSAAPASATPPFSGEVPQHDSIKQHAAEQGHVQSQRNHDWFRKLVAFGIDISACCHSDP